MVWNFLEMLNSFLLFPRLNEFFLFFIFGSSTKIGLSKIDQYSYGYKFKWPY